ncbi:hypothetical protein LSTR_LSTR003573 [Laodelphax striatellus]|uniref:Helicase SKI2W n=1 Tax=Laodelphax striatellus TaxID=195883 RepID=A0A482WKZ4_LAOST|nr:hypothetical protein LSTR_LSTR003573 [Laodelphax striatellus]
MNMTLENEVTFEPPPVCPNVTQELRQYLCHPEKLSIYNYEKAHQFWDRDPKPSSLKNFSTCKLASTLKVERDHKTGKLLGFKETLINPSLSEDILPINFDSDLLSTPPGLNHGYNFDQASTIANTPRKNIVNMMNILQMEDSFNLIDGMESETKAEEPAKIANKVDINTKEQDEIIPMEASVPVLKITEVRCLAALKELQWAEELEVKPVPDFYERVPKMAYTWDFELDPFQKLAIVKLEEESNVFVAAHTSAGKTVVAEYAIALSLQRCTRAIYTSPIKALSNQKYRDFKNNFEIKKKMGGVGLITGDIQMNPKAPCLIMTTEILRSMLYNRSEVVQDLEYVIFDEVHYINDPDRGHVWEEVMMLLANHVKIIMLSATVPNAIEFANWVGKSKNKKVYLISTTSRPVPLHFYLYPAPSGPKAKFARLYCIREADGPFNKTEYEKAVTAKEEPKNSKINQYQKRMNVQQLISMWKSFIIHLKKEDKLPVVIFVLSRARCDQISDYLKDLDIVSSKDNAHYIHQFFKKSIEHLKDEDRNLPQVKKMGELLEKGIGVHHSGILPILKEIVEMLFQKGKVQILLATETFAMGVNMPTKTVVFETIRKFDGTKSRELLPAEFIQMAGRAGRRGIDETGTVIILCKDSVPLQSELQKMMFTKPSELESQFKLTYATILKTLLRTGEATNAVEKLMSSSYKQHSEQYKQDDAKGHQVFVNTKINDLEAELNAIRDANLMRVEGAMENFYDLATAYIMQKKLCQDELIKNARWTNFCHVGRYVLVSTRFYTRRLGLIVSIERSKATCKVLIFVNPKELFMTCGCHPGFCDCELWTQMMNFLKYNERFLPDDNATFRIEKINTKDILEIMDMTDMYDERDFDSIIATVNFYQSIASHKKPPQLPRSALIALQNLHAKSLAFQLNDIIKFSNKVTAAGFQLANRKLESLKMEFGKFNVKEFLKYERQFNLIFQLKTLLNKKSQLDKLVNEYSMTGVFESKKQILKDLKYLDNSDNVELKGKGAIRLPSNEIMVTELIFRNILSDYQPPEIAALLSSLVFQAKTNIEMAEIEKQIPESLKKGMKQLEEIQKELSRMESSHCLEPEHTEFVELNFGLIHVVYQWACDKLFCETIEMTDVQEGIVVRCIQQLNEVLNSVKDVAQKVGDNSLKSKMEEASNSIKRDIVFAASLYLQ